jgi:hypothetical protein
MISDSSRELAFFTQTSANVPFFLTLTADLPGGLGIDVLTVLSNPSFTGVPPVTGTTPLPGALRLFGTGLFALGLFGWRKKRHSATRSPGGWRGFAPRSFPWETVTLMSNHLV